MAESKSKYIEIVIENKTKHFLRNVVIDKKHIENISQVVYVNTGNKEFYFANNCNKYHLDAKNYEGIACDIVSIVEDSESCKYSKNRVLTHDDL